VGRRLRLIAGKEPPKVSVAPRGADLDERITMLRTMRRRTVASIS
jgi:hypothetical protein